MEKLTGPKRLERSATIIRAENEDDENRTVELSFSSEEPYKRWFGNEILGHEKGEINLDFIESGQAPLLVDHKRSVDDQIGIIESVSIDSGKGRATVRFGKSERANGILERVRDGELTNVSVGYEINDMKLIKEEDDVLTYRVTDWKPYEISIVSIPADGTVGVGRSDEVENLTIEIKGTRKMDPKETGQNEQTRSNENAPAQVNKEDVVKAERARMSEITAIGRQFDQSDMAEKAIADGLSVDQFRKDIMEEMGSSKREAISSANDIGLSKKDAQSFSFLKAIRALANPTNTALREAAKFELECSQAEGDRLGRAAEGFFVPNDVLRSEQSLEMRHAMAEHVRALNVGTGSAGGVMVANDLHSGSFIELLRNQMMVRNLGAKLMTDMEGNFEIPRQVGGSTISWGGEGADANNSQPSMDQLAFSPNTASAYTEYTRRFMLQSSMDAEAFVRADLSLAMALGLDLAAIHGSGSGDEPTGVVNTTGIGAVIGGTNGAAMTWEDVVALETAVSSNNADIGALAYLTNANVRGSLKTTEKFAGSGKEIWGTDLSDRGYGLVNGYRAGVSNQVASNGTKGTGTNLSTTVFGNWADLIIAIWGGTDILVNPYALDLSGGTRVTIHQDADINVRHPESFAAKTDTVTQ